LLAVMINFSKMPEINEEKKKENISEIEILPKSSLFHYPHLIFGVLGLFFAAACEVLPIDGIIIYSRALGIPIEEARHFSTYTLIAMLIGYLASTILIPKYFSQNKALQLCSLLGIILATCSFFCNGILSIIFLILMGFGSAMLWGTIWGLSLRGLGKHTKTGSAMLLMAVIGGGIFPVIFGRLIDKYPSYPQNAVLLLIPCYFVLLFFSSYGYRLQSWKAFPKNKLKMVQ
jgi:MFS transporter, FHS family, L-fucose permease